MKNHTEFKNHIQFKNMPYEFTMIAIEGNMDENAEPFDMGGESWDNAASKPVHKVRLSDFWLCEHLVTQAVWAYIMQNTDLEKSSYFQGETRPVEQVSWNDIHDLFLPKLNKITERVRPEGTEYRLPTEAEWEYAARGGKYAKTFSFEYSGSDKLDEVGWYDANSHGETKPVGLKAPNFLGLYDMSGNVWEWCEDVYDSDFYKKCDAQGVVKNPCNREEGTDRVFRGGSWSYDAEVCRPTFRHSIAPSYRSYALGFRLVLFFPLQ